MNAPVLVPVHDARRQGVQVRAHADAEQEAGQQRLEVEDGRLAMGLACALAKG